jgi:hypothetical protein
MVRSDNPIPDNIPLYYFEVRIENEGKDGYVSCSLQTLVLFFLPSLLSLLYLPPPLFYALSTHGNRVFAIGLYPTDAHVQRGLPGIRHGFGYEGREGSKLSYLLLNFSSKKKKEKKKKRNRKTGKGKKRK